MKKIESQTRFLLKLILDILKTPIILILVILKKKDPKDLFKPFTDISEFIFQAKFTIYIILTNIFFFFLSIFFFSDNFFSTLVNYPSDFLSGRFFSLITAGFLHADLSHLFWNCVGIFVFGRVVEAKLGFSKTFFIYFGSLILSGLFSSIINLFLLDSSIGGIGASGALMGLVSTAILLDPFYISYPLIFPMPIMILGWLTIYADIQGILNPTADGIGHLAHLGGFISIALLIFFFGVDEKSKLKKGLIINLVSLIAGIIFYFLFI